METPFKYDPEDIESLLLHKQFHELYPEEKEFVLRHLGSPEEYESLRRTLFEVRDASRNDEWIEPDAGLKRALMAEFNREKRGGFLVWLNALFAAPARPWYRQTGWQVSFATVALAVGLIVFWPGKRERAVAEAQLMSAAPPADTSSTNQDATSSEPAKDAPVAFAEARPKDVPPAPITVTAYAEEQAMDEIPEPLSNAEYNSRADANAPAEELKDVSAGSTMADVDYAVASAPTSALNKSEATKEVLAVKKQLQGGSSPATMSMNVAQTKDVLDLLYTAK